MRKLFLLLVVLGLLVSGQSSSLLAQSDKVTVVQIIPDKYRTLKQLGCVPVTITTTATFQDTGVGSIPRENARKINEFIDGIVYGGVANNERSGYVGFVIDDDYAVADHDGNNEVITWPAFWGGEIITVGGITNGYYYHMVGSVAHRVQHNRLFYAGPGGAGTTMFHYKGAGAKIQMNLYGAMCQNDTERDAILLNYWHPETLMKITNGVDLTGGPSGADMQLGGHFCLAKIGIWFPAAGGSWADQMHATRISFTTIPDTYYRVDEGQSIGHFINEIECDGTFVRQMFLFNTTTPNLPAGINIGGGNLHVANAYHPNGCFLRLGRYCGAVNSEFYCDNLKLDNQPQGNTALGYELLTVDNQCPDGVIQVRIRGGMGQTRTKQMIKTVGVDGHAQADIQLDYRGMYDVERAAFPNRPLMGSGTTLTGRYPTSAFSSTKFWFDPNDLTSWAPTTIKDDIAVTTINDRSSANNDLVLSSGSGPKYRKWSTNWLPGVDFFPSANSYLKNATPTADLTTPGNMSIMVVVKKHTNLINWNTVAACSNPDGSGGWAIFILNDKVVWRVQGTDLTSTNSYAENQPILIVATRSTSGVMQLRVNGVLTTGTGPTGTLTAVTGPFIMGMLPKAAGEPYTDHPCKATVSQMFFDNVFWDIAENDETEMAPGSVGGTPWNASAYERLQYMRAGWGVW